MAITTPIFRVSYPNVFKPRRNDLNGKEEYSVVALFPKGADLTPLKNAAAAAAKEKWGDKIPSNLKSPFRDQGEREKDGKLPAGYEKGSIFLNLKSTNKPGVVDSQVQDIIAPSDFYGGCWARASVSAYAYDQKGNKGVAFGLGNLQKVKDGDPLGGRTTPTDDFSPVEMDTVASGGKKESADSLFG